MTAAPTTSPAVARVLAALGEYTQRGARYVACCPAHDDRRPSLQVSQGDDGRALLKCWSGCDNNAIRIALKLEWRDLFADSNDTRAPAPRKPRPDRPRIKTANHPASHWERWQRRFLANAHDQRLQWLAGNLGVLLESLRQIEVGFAEPQDLVSNENRPSVGAYTIPERNGYGQLVGFSLRYRDGSKAFWTGGNRGLILPRGISQARSQILAVEGASDVAALITMGLPAIGRPNNHTGAEHIARYFRRHDVLILGENDRKPDEPWPPGEDKRKRVLDALYVKRRKLGIPVKPGDAEWPGRDGAVEVAANLARWWKRPVCYALPPRENKDAREWLLCRPADQSWSDLGWQFRYELQVHVVGNDVAQKRMQALRRRKVRT